MRNRVIAMFLSIALATPAAGQGLMSELHVDVSGVQKKFVDLANAIPESAYAWRPAGARSIGEVLLHVAADNYLIPIMMGKAAPSASGITADMKTAEAFEKKTMSKAQIVAELDASFRHLHEAMNLTTEANLGENIKFFGQDWNRRRAMVSTIMHLHEHLGQFVAYARSNSVAPPWSQ